MLSRRQFLSSLGAAAVLPRRHVARGPLTLPSPFLRTSAPDPLVGWRGESAVSMGLRAGTLHDDHPRRRTNPHPPVDWATVGARLRKTYPDLRRHFVFEYYPWYGTNPWFHWNLWDRQPPTDIAATSIPRLGPYDSRSSTIIEQHARWIADAGVGAINISWWGQGSFEDQAVPLVMDVMRDHDIHVAFHLEPYRTDRVTTMRMTWSTCSGNTGTSGAGTASYCWRTDPARPARSSSRSGQSCPRPAPIVTAWSVPSLTTCPIRRGVDRRMAFGAHCAPSSTTSCCWLT